MARECLRTPSDLSVPQSLFDSDAMLLVGRLGIVAAALVMLAGGLFVLGSIAVRVRRGHWLSRAGPFEISDIVSGEVDGEIAKLELTVSEQRVRITTLEALLSGWTEAKEDGYYAGKDGWGSRYRVTAARDR